MPKAQTFPAAARAWLPLFALLILPFVLFWQLWWPDASRRLVFQDGDFVEQHLAMRTFVASELRAGRLPLWDPYTFAGQPALADSLFATFYPLGWWQTLFPAPLPLWALEAEAIAHLSLGGLFTFLLLRRLTGSAGAGLLGGLAFALSGWATAYPMLQLIILETSIWLPAGLWMIERALARRSLWNMGLAGALFGMALLAGHPQTFLYVAYLTVPFFFFRAWRLRVGWRFAMGAAGLLGAVILGLGAAQWFPSLQMYRFSPRFGLSYEEVAHGFAPRELWGLLRPNPNAWSPLYVGLVPLGLAGLALLLHRQPETLFWLAVLLLALLLSLGANGPLYPLAYRVAPGFAVFRDQERIALLATFALAMLAGYGYAALAARRPWVATLLPLLGLLIFADLFHANNGVILQAPPADGVFAQTPLVQHLQTVGEPTWRTSSEGLLPGGANAGLVFGVRDVVGSGPLYLAALDEFTTTLPELRWWRLLNVQHLLTTRTIEHGALLPVMQQGETRLYQVFVGGQPAWIVHQAEVVSDQTAAIARTAQPAVEPSTTAILEQPPLPAPAPATGEEALRIVAFEHQRLMAEATLSAPGIVVFSEVAYPGWVARANGKAVPTLRAYGLLRAVALPAGTWQIEWRFQPPLVYTGLTVSALTLLLLPTLYVWERRGE